MSRELSDERADRSSESDVQQDPVDAVGGARETTSSVQEEKVNRSEHARPAAKQDDVARPRKKRRRSLIIGAVVALLAVGGAAGVYAYDRSQAAQADESSMPKADITTETIVRGDLTGSTRVLGTLEYSGGSGIPSAMSGTITELPETGQELKLGSVAFRVDNRPVILMHGQLPAWRSFEYGMDDGPDVRQLEESLAALGFFTDEPDDTFGWPTATAIQNWQGEHGLDKTGEIEMGEIVFTSGDVRVGSLGAAVGDQVGPGADVLGVTGIDKIVSAELDLKDQSLGVLDKAVTVSLPGGTQAAGTVTSVGAPVETEGDMGPKVRIPVTVTLDDAADADGLQQADVSVDFASETREDVFSVPVSALLALPEGEFGVEILGADGAVEEITIETGLFTDGRVEISGEGLAEGQEVVVPSL
ncbi:peptidoglycan-binding protein [Actinoalloteichus hymeniacidonis]|uniref:peptidoglycan-binding protein n=1 Tax=Actinoalloteichus hymeniacidonis TaxID=340345 RepID=UPI0015612D0E|nr:peptidoglycan-binding protein [Actinoalloteichus hymeniacidonis]MBB5910612.1 peptidoglycan hydrolase-like protein with peptidoglycan-binding domain [Actinoalloteichus hymeniacidonis]